MKRNPPKASGLFDWTEKNLQREDWDFSGFPPEQAPFCLHYECMREIVYWRDRATAWTKSRKPQMPNNHYMFDPVIDPVLKHFPNTPWKKILASDRRAVVKLGLLPMSESLGFASESYHGGFEIVSPEKLGDGDKYHAWRLVHGKGRCDLYAAFHVNLRWTPERLTKAFRDWLQDHRPHDVRYKTQQGRGTPKDDLKAVGARRLLLAYGYAKAYTITEKELSKPLYGKQSSWSRARRRANYLAGCYACGTTD